MAPITHCVNNHDYTPENTVIGKDGKRRCRQCARDRDRRRPPASAARKQYLKDYSHKSTTERRADYLRDKRCAWCGSTDRLELDHINPADKLSNSFWAWSEERRNAELAKLQPLCHDCHLKKTLRQRLAEACRCQRCGTKRYRRKIRSSEKAAAAAAGIDWVPAVSWDGRGKLSAPPGGWPKHRPKRT